MIFKPFPKNIKFRKLFLYWFLFFIFGVFVMILITPLSPSFIESSKEISDNSCNLINKILIILAPFTETLIFMIIPYKIWKKKGIIFGIIIWSILHFITGNFPIFLYISIIGYFYYKCFQINKIKEVIFFHFIPNFLVLFSCFF